MTTSLLALWMPILLSAVIVFIASSILHMFTPWHKNDFLALPREAEVLAALRPFNIPPGDYMSPRPASMEDMKSAEFKAKMEAGPVLITTVIPSGPANMGRSLGLWFVFLLIVGVTAAFVGTYSLPIGAGYRGVFRIIGVVSFAGYALGHLPAYVWYHKNFATTMRQLIDGIVYAALTAGTFGWLWPR